LLQCGFMSAFGGKADILGYVVLCLLMTQSGHFSCRLKSDTYVTICVSSTENFAGSEGENHVVWE
jgi:hypothetical protein